MIAFDTSSAKVLLIYLENRENQRVFAGYPISIPLQLCHV